MPWFLHVTEGEDGRWACSHGRDELDTHAELSDALAHLMVYASTLLGQARIVVHTLDGAIEKLGPNPTSHPDNR